MRANRFFLMVPMLLWTAGAGCGSGEVDPCSGVTCEQPPAAECLDPGTRRVYSAGACVAGACEYPHQDFPCPDGCSGGQCLDSPPVLVDRSELLAANQRSTTDVRLVDLDGDSDLDIVWVSQPDAQMQDGGLDLTLNLGGGAFAAGDVSGIADIGSWTFALPLDVDGDGDPDLVLSRPANTSPEVLLLRNDGSGRLTRDEAAVPLINGEQHGYVFGRVDSGDFDRDGDLDLLVPGSFNQAMDHDRPNLLLLNRGDGIFELDGGGRLPAVPEFQDYTLSVCAGDLDRDGDSDLFLGEAERRQRIWINDGTGAFRDESDNDGAGAPRLPADPMRGYHCALVDLDRDGDHDIVVVNDASVSSGNPVASPGQAFFNDGTGHFTLVALPSTNTPHDARGLSTGDFDFDGGIDILIGNATETLSHGGTALEVLLHRGGTSYAPMTGLPGSAKGIFEVAAGDLNGDGFADIAAAVAEPDPSGGSLSNLLYLTQ